MCSLDWTDFFFLFQKLKIPFKKLRFENVENIKTNRIEHFHTLSKEWKLKSRKSSSYSLFISFLVNTASVLILFEHTLSYLDF